MAEIQEPVGKYFSCGQIRYIYKCCECGTELKGYHMSKIRGRVLCGPCKCKDFKKRYNNLNEKKSQEDFERGAKAEREKIMNIINGLDRQFGALVQSVLESKGAGK